MTEPISIIENEQRPYNQSDQEIDCCKMDDEVYASALQLGQLHKNNNGDEIKADYGQT